MKTHPLAAAVAAFASMLASLHAFPGGTLADAGIARVETGLLPRVSVREKLGVTTTIKQRMTELGIPGASIAVIDGGRLVWTRAYGVADTVEMTPVTTETLFQAASISKPIAALGALRLVKEGQLALDGEVNARLRSWQVAENEHTKNEKVTVRRLLSHTAGLTVHGFAGYTTTSRIPTALQVLDGISPANSAPVRVEARPGSQYRYSGGGYTVIQLLIADVSGESFESFMQSKVLDVLGMASSTFLQTLPSALSARRASGHRPGGERITGMLHVYPEMAAAGLWTTPKDLAQYLLYVQRAVHGEAGPVLDRELVGDMLTRQNGGPHGLGPELYEIGEFARFGHTGVNKGFEAAMVAYLKGGKGLVVMANSNRASMLLDEIKGSVARAYDWPGFPIRPQVEVQRISSVLLRRIPGRYRFDSGEIAEVRFKDGRLFLTSIGEGVFELFAKSPKELLAPQLGWITFELLQVNDRVTALKASNGGEWVRID